MFRFQQKTIPTNTVFRHISLPFESKLISSLIRNNNMPTIPKRPPLPISQWLTATLLGVCVPLVKRDVIETDSPIFECSFIFIYIIMLLPHSARLPADPNCYVSTLGYGKRLRRNENALLSGPLRGSPLYPAAAPISVALMNKANTI